MVIFDWVVSYKIGMSKFISFGNMVDLDESDFMVYFGDDLKIGVIIGYIEGVKDGRKFFDIVKEVIFKKFVVVFKSGRIEVGVKVVVFYIGFLVGFYKIY